MIRSRARVTRAPGTLHAGRFGALMLQAIVLAASCSWAAAPDLDSVSPRALRPGIPVEVKFSGRDLSGATGIWTTFSGNFNSLDGGRWRITPSNDCPVGIGAVRLFGSNGVSPLIFVIIDDLPTGSESGTNRTKSAAQRIRVGNAVDGSCNELGFDWFQLHADKNQRVAVEVVASRLGSKLDSVLRVFDAEGRVVVQNDDALGLRADSFVSFKAEKAGDFFIELRDVSYGGGPDFFYHLRVGDFPLATTSFPVAAEQGSERAFQLVGPVGSAGRAKATVSSNALVVPLASAGRLGSTFVKALGMPGREITEREPNDIGKDATRISLFEGINGRFAKAGDRDCYDFAARRGQRVEFRAVTRSVGSPADVMLELQAADGGRLGRSNPTSADEGILIHRFASNGTYRLIVEEVTGASGPNFVYRIGSQLAAGFALTVDAERVQVAPGHSFDLNVICQRGDYKGPVSLSLEAGDISLALTNNVIAEGKTNTTLKVTLPSDLSPESFRHFTVYGRGSRDATVLVRASTAPALRRRFPQMLHLPVELDGLIALGVTEAK